jgi:hypothetical protein
MNKYVKTLLAMIDEHYGVLSTNELAGKLFEIGVIDHTRCKVLAVREYVYERVAAGWKKFDAMCDASEHFSCSYEYVRKCLYYYNDVNIK